MSTRVMVAVALSTLLASAALANPVHAGLLTFEIQVDTSGLVPGPGGLVDISLGASMPPATPSVSVTVYGPYTDGSLGSLFTSPSGTAAGDLRNPGGVTLNNSVFTNELTQDFTVRSFFDVFVTIQGSEIGPGAVGPWSGTDLTITIFDSTPTGSESADFLVNPNAVGGQPIIDGTIAITPSSSAVATPAVPEPSSVILLGLGVVVAAGRLRGRRRAA